MKLGSGNRPVQRRGTMT